MKSKIIVLIILLLPTITICHEQNMHQYITREAWKLLIKSYPQLQNSEIANYIGFSETNSNQNLKSMGDGKIVSGAWIEDEYDILYHFGIGRVPTFNQEVTPFLYSLFLETPEDRRAAFTSITHFWDADGGPNAGVGLSDYASGIYWSFNINENAYQKIMKYYQGMYDLRLVYANPTGHSGCGTLFGLWWDMGIRDNLANYYKNNLWITSTQYFAGEQWLPASCYQTPFYKNWIYEILGRMCHLLQDMSVPAHVHSNSHAGTYGMYSDYYENNAKNFHQWTADELFSQGKVLLNPYQQNWGHPIAYLMYFLNQVTDHYASGIDYGDFWYDSSCPGLSAYMNPGDLPGLPSEINWANCSSMHDVLQPLAIRATAGLIYWFAVEANILPSSLTGVNVFGDLTLYQGGTGYWYAAPDHGIPQLSFQWEIMYSDGVGYLQNYASVKKEKEKKDKEKNKDGGVIIYAAPSNEWVPVGTNSSSFSKPFNPYDLRSFKLRCTVRDGSNTTKVSNEFYVDVVNTPPPQASMVADNSTGNTMKLEKENVEVQAPTSYLLN